MTASTRTGPMDLLLKAKPVPEQPFFDDADQPLDERRRHPLGAGKAEAAPPEAPLHAEALLEDLAEVADPIGKPERDRAAAGPEGPGEEVRIVGERRSAPCFDKVDEGAVHLLLQRHEAGDVVVLFRLEGIEHCLAFAG